MNNFVIKGRAYEIFKWMTMVLLPAFGTLYFALAGIWDLPYASEITKSILALTFFLGTILGLSNLNYRSSDARFDGTAFIDRLDPTNNPDVMLRDTNLNKPPKELLLKVQETAPIPGAQHEPDTPLDGLN